MLPHHWLAELVVSDGYIGEANKQEKQPVIDKELYTRVAEQFAGRWCTHQGYGLLLLEWSWQPRVSEPSETFPS